MFRKLQKKLTFFYSMTCGIILAGILLVCFFYMKGAVESRNQALFSSLFLNLSNQFQSLSFFSDQWLAQMETGNRLIIHIEENGEPIFFPGAWEPSTDREVLIRQALDKASREGLSKTSLSPGSARQTPLFYLSGNFGDSYCGMALQTATETGEKTLLVLQDISLSERQTPFSGPVLCRGRDPGISPSGTGKLEICRQDSDPPKRKQRKAGRIYCRCFPRAPLSPGCDPGQRLSYENLP